MRSVRVFICKEGKVCRDALALALRRERDFAIAGESSDVSRAISIVESLKPDVLIWDITIFGNNLGEECERLREKCPPSVKILALSSVTDPMMVAKLFALGVSGYVAKHASVGLEHLVRGIREVAAGRDYVSPPLTRAALDVQGEIEISKDVQHKPLTEREQEILRLVAQGNTSAAIARELSIGVRTVESHRANLIKKLELRSVVDLYAVAIQRGLVRISRK